MKYIVINIFFIFSYLNVIGQSIGASIDHLEKLIPPSPNAAAIEKFGIIPVNYSTGVPSINYPIWFWKRGKLDFNIELSYHAGGHKIDDMASNVGLGWALAGIPRISRTVKGLPDDIPERGYMYQGSLPDVITDYYNGLYYYAPVGTNQALVNPRVGLNQFNSTNYSEIEQLNSNDLDPEQDIFSYSIKGFSGRFIIDINRNIIPLEKTNLKFYAFFSTQGNINGFHIIDDNGILFKFEHLEFQTSINFSSEASFLPAIPGSASGWLLTKQIDPVTSDSIVYSYTNNPNEVKYETSFSESETYDLEEWDEMAEQLYIGLRLRRSVVNHIQISGNDPIGATISFPDGSELHFDHSHSRLDYHNSKALTGIIVKNIVGETIKKFSFHHSYFQSVSGQFDPPGLLFSNDNSKRLRLDSVCEISNDNQAKKVTRYSYNELPLNSRGSKNSDYWGYNVNPNRNNAEYSPSIPLEITELEILGNAGVLYQAFLSGSNKYPDPEYAKAAVLEKISYPTGGEVTFEYECNKAFSVINYYEDKLESNKLEWELTEFNQNINILLPGRTQESVQLFFKIDEIGPRPDPTGPPYYCLVDQQDLQPVSFEISSINGTAPSIIINDIYSNVLAGISRVVSLPLNQDYQVKFVYNAGINCSYTFPFVSSCIGKYSIPLEDKYAGGLRVKRIISDDGINPVLIKEYSYVNENMKSSAVLNEIPNFGYFRSTRSEKSVVQIPYSTITHFYDVREISRSSFPRSTLNYFHGSPLIYSRVIEKYSDGSSIEIIYDPFNSEATGQTYFNPILPTQDFPNLSGLLTKKIIKNSSGELIKENSWEYNKNKIQLPISTNRNYRTGTIAYSSYNNGKTFVANNYSYYTSIAEEIFAEEKSYGNALMLSQFESKTYNANTHYLSGLSKSNSKGEEIEQSFFYADDYTGNAYSIMEQLNIKKVLAGDMTYKLPIAVGNEISYNRIHFSVYNNNMPLVSLIEASVMGGPIKTIAKFEKYDDKGNLLQYTSDKGVPISLIWGYNKQYPVAKIIGKTYESLLQESSIDLNVINSGLNNSLIKTELDRLFTLEDVFVTTYIYKPLVGKIIETDPNGFTMYYEYDNFNRLHLIRDKDNNILKKFCYNYQGQVADCGFGNDANWVIVSTTCELDGMGQFTGNTIVVNQDLNPSSPTFNQQVTSIAIDPTPICVCSGQDKKVINGVCETGVWICLGNFKESGMPWKHYYRYQWSDFSLSPIYVGEGICNFNSELEP